MEKNNDPKTALSFLTSQYMKELQVLKILFYFRLLRSRISENGRTHWRSTEIEVERYLNLSIIYARYNYTANYYRRKAEAKNVEITGYALLALIERERRLNNQERKYSNEVAKQLYYKLQPEHLVQVTPPDLAY